MTRNQAIAHARVAGYHEDTATFTRLICEQRVNRQTMNDAFYSGRKARANGMKCSCRDCNPKPTS
jgi:hypothetical protein